MKSFPNNFNSQKEYNSYFNCLSNLKIGDKVIFTYGGVNHEAVFLCKDWIVSAVSRFGYDYWLLTLGSDSDTLFYKPTPTEKKTIIAPAKKVCPSIMIGSTNIFRLPNTIRVTKIIKYHGEQKKEKEEKESHPKKSVRSKRKNAKFSWANEA